MGNKKTRLFAGVLTITLLIFLVLNSFSVFRPVEETLLDIKFRTFQRDLPENDVVLIMIDEQSLDKMRSDFGIYWPWPREVYSYLHNYLSSKGATLIVYDIIMDQPDFDRTGFQGSTSDQALEISMQTYGNAVTVGYSNPSEIPETELPDRFTFDIPGLDLEGTYSVSNLPVPAFLEASRALGSVSILAGNETLIRNLPLFFDLGQKQFLPSLSMAAYLALPEHQDDSVKVKDNQIMIGDEEIRFNEEGKYLVNWYSSGGGGLEGGTFPNYSFVSVLRNAIQFAQTGEEPEGDLIDIKGKVVMIGANAAGLSDIKSTPMSPYEPFPGVEIHATALQNFMDSDFITVVGSQSWGYRLVLVLLITLLSSIVFFRTYQLNIPVTIGVLLLVSLGGLYLFSAYRVWIPTAESFVMLSLTAGIGFVVKYVTEGIEKKQIRSAFGMYVQKELVDKITDNPGLLKLGGQKKELTIIFSDLEGFTSISEKYDPQDLVTFLNEYLTEMTNVVFRNQGTLDKYIGDAIMAFWGAPLDNDNHAFHACRCVLEMRRSLKKLQEKWKEEGKPTPGVRFGINTGEVVVGNMGSGERFDYTVLGDQVNLAARLEPANKEFGTKILMSEFTHEKIKDQFYTREAGKIRVKGKEIPVTIFELLDEKKEGIEVREDMDEWIREYDGALELYYTGQFDEAATAFLAFEKKFGDDELVQGYLKKIAHYQAFPPLDDWDGVHEQISK